MKKKQPPARRPHKPYSPHRGITVLKSPPPVRIENAACAKCGDGLCYSPHTWVFCPACSARRIARQLAAGKAVAS